MKHSATQTLYSHWRSLRGERRTPDRNDLDPTAIRTVLSYTFMLEVDKGQPLSRDYPIRLSGTRLDALFGQDLKGTSFISLWRGIDQTQMRLLIADVMDDACPALVGSRGAPSGCADVALELVLLPLRHAGRTHARILCCLSPAATPAWIGLQPAEPLTLVSWRMLHDTAARAIAPQFGAPSPSDLPPGRRTGRGHLVVHEGGKGRDVCEEQLAQSPFNTAGAKSFDSRLSIRHL
ncbi:PAS domain-containing protein [Lichenifustis flavocetrariae]|uniref:PAS domain-containing protein n=1 Tax=Lichenifustis flavocetrariae TaxID=2949735 RepID=A0AA41YXL1_9HYPH|nr:PAS domain-containing protein [Lichenifustis flavocetrariae]MCW6509116.1 PAS domain-containing protein [Lichenifustis flavocetrariae]